MVEFYHKKRIDMVERGCTLPNLANICLHSSTSAEIYPFTENDTELLSEICESMIGGPSTVFTGGAVVDRISPQRIAN